LSGCEILSDALAFRTNVQQDGNRRRLLEDDQGPLTESAGIIRVTHPANGNVRGLVQLDRLVAHQTLQQYW